MYNIRLTSYSHGAGCGCKIAPSVLDHILAGKVSMPEIKELLVGNSTRDDAALFDLGDGRALISTTDFFMPIVDDPFTFGRIAAANAISDVYAMGGEPMMAIAILGWPVEKIPAKVASMVVDGGKSMCLEAGIPLAGGHSIDSPEPIFGLAVNGIVRKDRIKRNDTAQVGDLLFLTKPIGVGILTTAEKKGHLKKEHSEIAPRQMMRLNKVGTRMGELQGVHAMTDVTGFGLLGHLKELADGSGVTAEISYNDVPTIVSDLSEYINLGCVPGGTERNWNSYGASIRVDPSKDADMVIKLLADPQTSGGLLISVSEVSVQILQSVFKEEGLSGHLKTIGRLVDRRGYSVLVR